jgi:hypothetical protein
MNQRLVAKRRLTCHVSLSTVIVPSALTLRMKCTRPAVIGNGSRREAHCDAVSRHLVAALSPNAFINRVVRVEWLNACVAQIKADAAVGGDPREHARALEEQVVIHAPRHFANQMRNDGRGRHHLRFDRVLFVSSRIGLAPGLLGPKRTSTSPTDGLAVMVRLHSGALGQAGQR